MAQIIPFPAALADRGLNSRPTYPAYLRKDGLPDPIEMLRQQIKEQPTIREGYWLIAGAVAAVVVVVGSFLVGWLS